MSVNNLTSLNNLTTGDMWTGPVIEVLDKYVTPIIYVVGFPGNIISFIIWMQKRMRHSSGYYLAALAMEDLIFLLLHLVFKLHVTWGITVLNTPFVCEIYTVVYVASQYLSPFLVLAFTTERYISVCHPFKRETYCTIRRAKIVIVCLVAFMPCLTAINGYFWYFTEIEGCTTRPEVKEGDSKSLYTIYITTIEMLVFLVVPVTILVLNILVIREMRRLSRVEQNQLHGSSQRTGSTTIMLLTVSFYQIVTTLPVSITLAFYFEYSCEPLNSPKCNLPEVRERNAMYSLILNIINTYGITHYAFNIFIYLITGKMFRQEAKKLILRPFAKLFSSLPSLPTNYATLRTSVRGSTRNNTWVSANGCHSNNIAANETLL